MTTMTPEERAKKLLERWRAAPSGPHDKLADLMSEIRAAEASARDRALEETLRVIDRFCDEIECTCEYRQVYAAIHALKSKQIKDKR